MRNYKNMYEQGFSSAMSPVKQTLFNLLVNRPKNRIRNTTVRNSNHIGLSRPEDYNGPYETNRKRRQYPVDDSSTDLG